MESSRVYLVAEESEADGGGDTDVSGTDEETVMF
jgi:hypothetical protein